MPVGRWSPGEGLVYYLARRDGMIPVWALRLTRDESAPRGDPFLVAHLGHMMPLHPRARIGCDAAPSRLLVISSRWESSLRTGMTR